MENQQIPMSPEALLARYAERIGLQNEDVDYLIGLLQMARGLGSDAAIERVLGLVAAERRSRT